MSVVLRPYPEYRSSGLLWAGAVPEHWETWQLGHFCRIGNGSTPSRANRNYWADSGTPWLNSSSVHQGRITKPHRHVTDLALRECHLPRVPRGSVLVAITGQGKTRGTAALLDMGATISQHVVYLQPSEGRAIASYLRWLMAAAYRELRRISDGSGGTKGALTCQDIRHFKAALPPVDEQQCIANFLDAHGRLVARYIRNKRRLIALLNEQKQAIVDRAVTRGVEAGVRLVPSGVAWLGDVPAGWGIRSLKQVAEVRVSGVDKNSLDGEVPVRLCNYTDVYNRDYITAEIDFMPATATSAEVASFTLRRGDVLITKDSELWDDIAVPALVTENMDGVLCGYHLALIRPDPSPVSGEFLFRALTAPTLVRQFNVAANGVTRYGLSKHAIKNAVLPVPELDQQQRICRWISEKLAPLSTAVARAQSEIALIREYRTRLIADVVTGKLDVRQVALDALATGDGAAELDEVEAALADDVAEDHDLLDRIAETAEGEG